MDTRSLKTLLFLVAAAVTASGWLFSWKWKQQAGALEKTAAQLRDQLEGNAFTGEEKVLIDLQNQNEALRRENERLARELQNRPDDQ